MTPLYKKQATAVVYSLTATVMNEIGEEREFTAQSQDYEVFLQKLEQINRTIDNLYKFNQKEDSEIVF